jgi:hypothetical protein
VGVVLEMTTELVEMVVLVAVLQTTQPTLVD